MNKKNLLLLLSAIVAAFSFLGQHSATDAGRRSETAAAAMVPAAASAPGATGGAAYPSSVDQAIARHARDVEIEGSGTVVKVLRDDTDGSRHQKFLLRIDSGATLLVAHNIDLAPRVENLHEGDLVDFHGEYVWNEKGGVLHWTHHDPSGQHPAGWLRHAGNTYQ